jgi:rod shape-determining protein MreC
MLTLPTQTTARLKLAIGSVFLPLFGLTGSVQQLASGLGDKVISRNELLKQNEALYRENQQLRIQAMRNEAVERENNRLRTLIKWQQQQKWKLALGRVILREPANWWRTVQIDLGSRDGIRPNMPVVTPEGLAGRVASVLMTRSQIVLLGDPNCKVAARIDNETKDTGIIGPGGPLARDLVELGFLTRASSIKSGQNVRTTGEGGIFPRDLPIGTIVDFQPVESGLSAVARVKLSANLGNLDEVFVILDQPAPPEGTK